MVSPGVKSPVAANPGLAVVSTYFHPLMEAVQFRSRVFGPIIGRPPKENH